MGREPIARIVGRLLWGGDVRPFFRSMAVIGQVGPAATIVDAPCGAGNAFRGLSPADDVRYIGVDISKAMLERARHEADERGLGQVELVQADVTSLPLDDSAADLFLSYWALHCLDDPEAALDEVARCLRPSGRLVGASFVRGSSIRQRLLVRPHHQAFGRVPSPGALRRWLERRFDAVELQLSGLFAYFSAERANLRASSRNAKTSSREISPSSNDHTE